MAEEMLIRPNSVDIPLVKSTAETRPPSIRTISLSNKVDLFRFPHPTSTRELRFAYSYANVQKSSRSRGGDASGGFFGRMSIGGYPVNLEIAHPIRTPHAPTANRNIHRENPPSIWPRPRMAFL